MANSYLSKTFSSAGNRNKWTVSVWLKRSKLGAESPIFTCVPNGNFETFCGFGSNDTITFKQKNDGSTSGQYVTNRKFRDTNGFYHLVFVYDKDNSTAGDRGIIYVNGVRETSFSTSSNFSDSSTWNSTSENWIGKAGSSYFDGYMSHVAFVDGQALAPTVFGETDSTSGIWKFKSPSGVTWGDNGFHLKFENSANMGLDSSGETNNFTASGNLKQTIDTPSNVFATLNALATSSYSSLTQGNNTVKGNNNANDGETYSTLGTMNKGKWYWEIKATGVNGSGNPKLGFVQSDRTSVMRLQNGGSGLGGAESGSLDIMVRPDGKVLENGSTSSVLYNTFSAGNILSFALDSDNGAFYYAINGTWQNSGNPASGASRTGAIKTWTPTDSKALGGQHVCIGSYETTTQADCNFGSGFFGTTAITSAGSNGNGSLFEYDVPSGYYALNTKNINTYG